MEDPAFIVDVANASGKAPSHPYYPLNAPLAHYAANSLSSPVLVASFVAGSIAIFAVTLLLIQQSGRTLSKVATLTTLWFALCGCIHLFFEGYFAVHFTELAGQDHLFAQLWKEYSLSDSRYLTQDSFLVCMEGITAFIWGPLSFLLAWAIVKDNPIRFPLQLIISLGQIYGNLLYYGTCFFSKRVLEIIYCRPESFYFWWYYFFCNFIWIMIPVPLLAQSIWESVSAFAKVQAAEKAKKKA